MVNAQIYEVVIALLINILSMVKLSSIEKPIIIEVKETRQIYEWRLEEVN